MTGELPALADFVSRLENASIPDGVRAHACAIIADTLSVMMRGSTTDEASRLIATVQSSGPAVLMAEGYPRASVDDAILINAVSGCSIELSEGIRPTGHPAIHLLPPLLAQGQQLDVSGSRFLTAFIIGYEIHARLQRATELKTQVHCHGNLGHVGVAAALAWLRGADPTELLTVMNGAAGLASATSYSLPYGGASMHFATPAMSGRAALMVDRLAQAGFTSFDGSVEEVFGRILGGRFDPSLLTANLGEKWAVESGYVKFHAACGHSHPVMEALINALEPAQNTTSLPWKLQRPLPAESIRSVLVRVNTQAAQLGELPAPETPLAARFSIRYAVAAMLVTGSAGVDAFEQPALHDPAISSLAERVVVEKAPEFDELFPSSHIAEVALTFDDGSTVTGRCNDPYGSPQRRASWEHRRLKFDELLHDVMSAEESGLLWTAAMECDQRTSMRGFPG